MPRKARTEAVALDQPDAIKMRRGACALKYHGPQCWPTSTSANQTTRMVMNNRTFDRASLRLSATLLLGGQLLYIVVTQFHADGPANNHATVFAESARSGIWTPVHVGQFAAMAILLAGLLALRFALDVQPGTASWAGRLGGASAVAALALYGGLQA